MNAKERKLLEWANNQESILEIQVTGSGLSKALNELLILGYVTITAHPTVKNAQTPAAAVVITDKGRSALSGP